MKKMKYKKSWIVALITLFLFVGEAFSQNNQNDGIDEKAAQILFENQKFNVVIGIISVIFIGVVLYIIRLDRKISKLEKK